MSIANWCILAACLLPILTVGLAKGSSSSEKYDNKNPREWATRLTGWQQRAYAAQINGFEALPLFIAAVILAQQAHADQGRIDILAMVFIAMRISYVATYLMNLSALRTVVWGAGLASSIAILVMA